MAKNLAKVTEGQGACGAKAISLEQGFSMPWVIYNPDSTNFKVLYSVHGELSDTNEFYGGSVENPGGEFADCTGSGSGSGE